MYVLTDSGGKASVHGYHRSTDVFVQITLTLTRPHTNRFLYE